MAVFEGTGSEDVVFEAVVVFSIDREEELGFWEGEAETVVLVEELTLIGGVLIIHDLCKFQSHPYSSF